MNVLDNMVEVLEHYASNLEHVVEQRTRDIIDEKKKAENVLHSILPRYPLCSLSDIAICKNDTVSICYRYCLVSIYFVLSSIIGATAARICQKYQQRFCNN